MSDAYVTVPHQVGHQITSGLFTESWSLSLLHPVFLLFSHKIYTNKRKEEVMKNNNIKGLTRVIWRQSIPFVIGMTYGFIAFEYGRTAIAIACCFPAFAVYCLVDNFVLDKTKPSQ